MRPEGVRLFAWVIGRLFDIIISKGGRIQLYNLKEDIGEARNLAVDYPEKVKMFDSLMRVSRTESDLFRFGRNNRPSGE